MSPQEQLDRRRVRRVSDDRILDSAASEFAAEGFAGASMQAIAHGARTTKATIYANLGDKDNLYETVISREAAALRETLLAAYSGASGSAVPDQLRAGIGAIFTFAEQRPPGFRLLLGGVADNVGTESVLRRVYQEVIDAITAMVQPRLERAGVTNPGAAPLIASMLVGMFRSAATTAVVEGSLDGDAAAAVAKSLAEHGLRGLDVNPLNDL